MNRRGQAQILHLHLAVWLTCLSAAVVAWDYNSQSYSGPTRWSNSYPSCAAANNYQLSPISFSASERNSQAVSYTLTMARYEDDSVDSITFATKLNGGGLLVATPLQPFPMRVINASGGSGSIVTVKYVVEIAFHSSVEHTGAQSTVSDSKVSMEVHYVLASSLGGVPDVVFVQQVTTTGLLSGTTAAFVDQSIAYTVLKQVAANSALVSGGTPLTTVIDRSRRMLLLNTTSSTVTATDTSGSSFASLAYSGSMTYPPCVAVEMVVSNQLTYLPPSVIAAVAAVQPFVSARSTQSRVSGLSLRRVIVSQSNPVNAAGTLLYTPNPVQIVPVYVTRRVANPKNEHMMAAIMALVATNAALMAGIAVLALARLEYINLPMWLGGLNRDVEWWTNPASVESDEEKEEDEEEYDEEDDQGDEGDVSHDGDGASSPDQHV